ncbi:terminase large subunit domain-containing protein [Pseudothauera hydrothermalis]|uniref:terminase large subunit domain-containing protein n=1 Tax=Pseudothauera hydrothermalis TaxID=2184083 RepID=UPI000E09B242|nr:terminase family protein [Pseudothauera hydrothermalis]
MPARIQDDVRRQILAAIKRFEPSGEIAARFGVSRKFVDTQKRRLFGPGTPGGQPRYGEDVRREARSRYLAGEPVALIAAACGVHENTLRAWARDYGWREELANRRQTPAQLEAEIAEVTALLRQADEAQSYKLTLRLRMLQKALAGIQKSLPKPKPLPKVANFASRELFERAIAPEYGLLPYQRRFLEDDARYRCVLKARQIGFTYVIGLSAVLGLAAGRDQIIVSASEDQARLVMGHLRAHAEKLGLPIEDDTDREIRIMGSKAVALSTNWRTAQGYTGDVWFDEFAWAPRPDALFNAVVPAITRVGGRITVCSTPWVPGNLFWKIATDHQGRYSHYSRHVITIHDALKDGMPLPGGLDELRLNFDAASWAMFFECQWAEEEGALLPWSLLDAIAEDIHPPSPPGRGAGGEGKSPVGKKAAAPRYGRLRLGVDLGRVADRTALVLVGELLDPVSLAPTARVRVLKTHSVQGMDFASQRSLIEDWIARFDPEHVAIDRSGLGWQLAEELARAHPGRVLPRAFTAPFKERLALDLLRLAEQKRLSIPRDPSLMAELHAVRRIPTASGIRYDAPRDASGHADRFWALALALDGMDGISRAARMEVELW